MTNFKIVLVLLTSFISGFCMAQAQQDISKDTRGFYTFGWDSSKNGQAIKPFSMTTSDGKKINSSDLKGKVVVLDFWATWCAPCRELTKELNKNLSKYYGDDFLMIGVNYKESTKKGNPVKYWEEHGYKFPMTINNDAYGKSIDAGNPTVLVIDKEGIIRGKFDGGTDRRAEEIETLLWTIIEKPEVSINSVVDANRNKEYVKAVYLADQVMKNDPAAGLELTGEKLKALLRVSEWDAVDYSKNVIAQSKDPDDLERNLTDGAVSIAEATELTNPKIFAYGAELFETLITKYNLSDHMIVNDLAGRCYFKSGDKTNALKFAQKSLAVAQSTNQPAETITYLQGVLDKYNQK